MSRLQAKYAVETDAAMTDTPETDAAVTPLLLTPGVGKRSSANMPGDVLECLQSSGGEEYQWARRKHETQHLQFAVCLLFTFNHLSETGGLQDTIQPELHSRPNIRPYRLFVL